MRAMVAALLLLAATPAGATPQSDLMDADRAFSRLSMKSGRPYAFLVMATDNARLFGAGGMAPIYGRAQAFRALSQREAGRMHWEPQGAGVSGDGKMGWTDGRWDVATSGKVSSRGHYLTIWVKDRRGAWKVQAHMRTSDPISRK